MTTNEPTEAVSSGIESGSNGFDVTLGERGPQGFRHVPSFTNDCYYQRPNCCWLCSLRIALPIRRGGER
jgi:hypothetical protein